MSNEKYERNENFARGFELRQRVLGEEHVQKSLALGAQDPALLAMQQLTTEFAWGQVWTREGLPLKTRSFLSLAFLAASGKHEEFRTHVRGALNNGASKQEITEVIVQAAVYCGFPVGLECMRIAKQVMDEQQPE